MPRWIFAKVEWIALTPEAGFTVITSNRSGQAAPPLSTAAGVAGMANRPFSQVFNPVNRRCNCIALPVHDERVGAGLDKFVEEMALVS
jgi:hypothetical protein